MQVRDARRWLCLGDVYDEGDVKSAFVDRARKAHPDAGNDGADIGKMKEARDVLLADLRAFEEVCTVCDGKGSVRRGFVSATCRACKGEGR